MSTGTFGNPKTPQAPQITILGCTFIAVGRHKWDSAIKATTDGIELGNSIVAPHDLLKWRYFLQYKTRNLGRTLRRLLTKGTI